MNSEDANRPILEVDKHPTMETISLRIHSWFHCAFRMYVACSVTGYNKKVKTTVAEIGQKITDKTV